MSSKLTSGSGGACFMSTGGRGRAGVEVSSGGPGDDGYNGGGGSGGIGAYANGQAGVFYYGGGGGNGLVMFEY